MEDGSAKHYDVCSSCTTDDVRAKMQLVVLMWRMCLGAAEKFWKVVKQGDSKNIQWHYEDDGPEIEELCADFDVPGLIAFTVLEEGIILYNRAGCVACTIPAFRQLLSRHVTLGAAILGLNDDACDVRCSEGVGLLVEDALQYWKDLACSVEV